MSEGTWRSSARRRIQKVIAEVGMADEAALRKAISAAYPFGARSHYPYKVWLDEVKKQIAAQKRMRAWGVQAELTMNPDGAMSVTPKQVGG